MKTNPRSLLSIVLSFMLRSQSRYAFFEEWWQWSFSMLIYSLNLQGRGLGKFIMSLLTMTAKHFHFAKLVSIPCANWKGKCFIYILMCYYSIYCRCWLCFSPTSLLLIFIVTSVSKWTLKTQVISACSRKTILSCPASAETLEFNLHNLVNFYYSPEVCYVCVFWYIHNQVNTYNSVKILLLL